MNNFMLETISNKYSLVMTIALNIPVITLILPTELYSLIMLELHDGHTKACPVNLSSKT